jgi:hypothetical protein
MDRLMLAYFNRDFPERRIDSSRVPSIEDKFVMYKVDDSLQFDNGHYLMSLPFKYEPVHLLCNDNQVLQRLARLRKKIPRDHVLHADYTAFMSSPTCANIALRRAAVDTQHLYGPDVSEAVLACFYVDDLLKSFLCEEQAILMIQSVTDVCNRDGFHQTKLSSNSRNDMQSLPEQERSKQLTDLDLEHTHLPTERALGVNWCAEYDQFGFEVMDCDGPTPTRRVMLSVICSIFDPLGLGGPFILKAKILLQDLCRRGLSWDHEISGDDLIKWQNWLTDLIKLHDFNIPICIKFV